MLRIAVIGIFLSCATGCYDMPRTTPESSNAAALKALQQDREAFEAAARGDKSEAILDRLKACGIGRVISKDRAVVFVWKEIAPGSAYPVILYAPKGREDLPANFFTSHYAYAYPMAVDDNWFVARVPN